MRTPVAAIEGYLALALNPHVSKVDDKAKSYLLKAHDATQHLGELFQDLLTSSKADDGRLTNDPELVEVGDFLSKLTDDLRFVAQKKNLTVEYVLGTSGASINSGNKLEGSTKVIQPLYNIYVDPERLREVITNLFDNAVKFTNSGKISIGLTGDNNVVQIYVKDTGVGMAPEDVPHLFQKFYRLDNSATRTVGGSGLGLYIARKIIELYNGQIWVESELGKGSTFFINLPRLSNQRFAELSTHTKPTALKPEAK
jgi:signal transduction histidine kinase